MENSPSIQARNLTFGYQRRAPVLQDLTFSIAGGAKQGKVLALLGRSGSGKSTLLRLVAGLTEPIRGSVSIVPPLSRPAVYLNQSPVLLEHYSRLENARYRATAGWGRSFFSESRYASIRSALGLGGSFLDDQRPMRALSGGEAQRLALLRDLSVEPELVLLDEPCAGLDPLVKQSFLLGLREALCDTPALVLYVTHHFSEVELIADEVGILSGGPGGTFLHVRSLAEVKRRPPTEEAARLIAPHATSTLAVDRVGERYQPASDGVGVARLVVGPSCVRGAAAREDGFAAVPVGSSASYGIARIGHAPGAILYELGEHQPAPAWLKLEGVGHLFPHGGGEGELVRVSTLRHEGGGACLEIETLP